MSPTPIWLDNNILVGIDNGTLPYAEREIINLQKDGFKPLLPPSVEREFLHGPGFRQVDTVRRQAVLKRLGIEVDTMVNRVPMQQLIAWREQGVIHGLSIPDADSSSKGRRTGARHQKPSILYKGRRRNSQSDAKQGRVGFRVPDRNASA